MARKLTRSASLGARQLLDRILEQPSLVAAVQALPAVVLGKLINHVGLEDAGEIVALATTEQIRGVFDDDLWRSERPGQDESFDADRFGRWLEIMLEAGEAFTAQRLAELPEDLVTLALSKQVLVINIEEMAVAMSGRQSDDDALLEKALESTLGEEIGEYRIISRRYDGWDAVLSVLLALDRDHHDVLERLLERCCYAAGEYIEENGGLFHVLTSEEMLEADAAAEREDRRGEEGYIAPSSAASFLALARTTRLAAAVASPERDPITSAYFRGLARRTASGAPVPTAGGTAAPASAANVVPLLDLMREAEVLPPAGSVPLLGPARPGASDRAADLLGAVMRRLRERSPEHHAQRMAELAYLANVLLAGSSLEGRPFRPAEAATAALAVCNLGLDHVAQREAKAVAALLERGADWLFRVGWRILTQEVAGPAARTIDALLAPRSGSGQPRDLAALRAALASDKPWTVVPRLAGRVELGAPVTAAALLGLIDECPHLAGSLLSAARGDQLGACNPSNLEFIASGDQIGSVCAWLAGLGPR